MNEFAVKVDGADIAPIDMSALHVTDRAEIQNELDRLDTFGVRGWGAKFIVEKQDGTHEIPGGVHLPTFARGTDHL